MRDSVVFYKSFRDAIKRLPQEEQLKAYDALFDYAFEGEETSEGIAAAILLMAMPQIDANNQRYENGRKGGRPKTEPKPNDNQSETKPKPNDNQTITETEPSVTNPEPNVNVNVNVNDNDLNNNSCPTEPDETEKDQDETTKEREARLQYNFDQIYKVYPRKERKQDGYSYYRGYVGSGRKINGRRWKLTDEQIFKAVKKYSKEVADKDERYIQQFGTFMNKTILDYVEET